MSRAAPYRTRDGRHAAGGRAGHAAAAMMPVRTRAMSSDGRALHSSQNHAPARSNVVNAARSNTITHLHTGHHEHLWQLDLEPLAEVLGRGEREDAHKRGAQAQQRRAHKVAAGCTGARRGGAGGEGEDSGTGGRRMRSEWSDRWLSGRGFSSRGRPGRRQATALPTSRPRRRGPQSGRGRGRKQAGKQPSARAAHPGQTPPLTPSRGRPAAARSRSA